MGNKIFASYKYSDSTVKQLNNQPFTFTTVRDYVDEFEKLIDDDDHIYKGESDDDDLSHLEEETIARKLRDRMYDSSVTIVFISKGMKENSPESQQWIPWEVCYSLKEVTRGGRTSLSNVILAVVVPDTYGNYDYILSYNRECNSRTIHTNFLFPILRKNMFNTKNPVTRDCNGNKIYSGYESYIYTIDWDSFIANYNKYIGVAIAISENIDDYTIVKELE